MKVLIADDEENIRNLMQRYLSLSGVECDKAENGLSAQRKMMEEKYDAVMIDFKMPGLDGISLIKWMREEGLSCPAIMISAHGEITDAVEALKSGADDYLVKPFDPEEAVRKLKRLTNAVSVTEELNLSRDSSTLVWASADMKRIKDVIEKVAPSNATVLITGESGTGKEVVAKEIHFASLTPQGPFVALNIGGVQENLLESELFGYEKGAFTGADKTKVGLFETAEGGTLFLDEIGDMPISLQVKLLRVLQERKTMRLGGTEVIDLNTRIIAATNKDIEKLVKDGSFREDLFYRLNVVRIHVPPLRERKEDIPPLVGSIITRYNKEMKTDITGISAEALELIMSYPFYGNVRELENIIERAMIFATRESIAVKDIEFGTAFKREGLKAPQETGTTLRDIERATIKRALIRWEGNRTKAADELGISRRTLINKIAEYGLDT